MKHLRLSLLVFPVLILAAPSSVWAQVPDPVVEGPVQGGIHGHPLMDNWFDLAPYGYVEEEFFISGMARTYPGDGTRNGAYKTRLLVFRPADPNDFNGAVVLEWENVTGQTPAPVTWLETHSFYLREGYAFVAASAQMAGICCSPISLQGYDPVRYMSLTHPGDTFSFDIFSQAAQAVRSPTGIDPLGNLPTPERVIGAGQSQSASRLASYANLVRDVRVVDGLYIDAGGGLNYPPDLDIPIIHARSEGEIAPGEPNAPFAFYRLWEISGRAHTNALEQSQIPFHVLRGEANAPKQTFAQHEAWYDVEGEYGEDRDKARASCGSGDPYPGRFLMNTAIHNLNEWAKDPSYVPPVGPRVQYDAGGAPLRDEFGNVLGGIRLPPIDVPVATYLGDQCGLFGDVSLLCEAQLELLYPSHEDYVDQMQAATDEAVAAGFLLPDDGEEIMMRAARSVIGNLDERSCPEQPDFDGDGTLNATDNCPVHTNAGQADGDGDGRGDVCDNCPFIPNPGQEDNGGIGTSERDGIGNACQCGDFLADGVVNGQDGFFITRFGLDIADPIVVNRGNCDVNGNGVCNGQDGFFTARASLGFDDPSHVFGQNCPNADPTTPCPYCP